MQGWRTEQEDQHIAKEVGGKAMLFAVFDGHGGKAVSDYAEKRFAAILESQ